MKTYRFIPLALAFGILSDADSSTKQQESVRK